MKNFITIGSIFGALAVMIGAFGAHALKGALSPYELGVYNTGNTYHFYHALALVAYGIFQGKRDIPSWPAWFFIAGIIIFSGSLYLLAILHMPKFGMITPIGGLAFIIGWVGFAFTSKSHK